MSVVAKQNTGKHRISQNFKFFNSLSLRSVYLSCMNIIYLAFFLLKEKNREPQDLIETE